jgi:hypothetical protein
MLFIRLSSYGDMRYLWSTARPTIEGVNTTVIPMNSVKSEFIRCWDEYAFFSFSEKNIFDREYYIRLTEMITFEPGYRQFGYWLKNTRNFVIAFTSTNSRGNVTFSFAVGNFVYECNFNIFGFGVNTINNTVLRREWEIFIDKLLQGL